MKKVFTLLMGAGMLAFLACGPNAADLQAKKQDSIRKADSLKAIADAEEAKRKREMDSIADIAKAAAEKSRMDSIRMDSIAKASAKPASKPKTKEQKKVEEAKKVSSGRG